MYNEANIETSRILSTTKKKFICRPFLKWVGGKAQLLPELLKRVPRFSGRYFEPFVGGGALFFGHRPTNAYLSDVNSELINSYVVVRDQVEKLIEDLHNHVYEEQYFYDIRNIDRDPSFSKWSAVRRASRLIYLNKTCFNGLFRVNSKGHFNTPFGRYVNPTIVDEVNLRACSKVLRNVNISIASFDSIEAEIKKGDFIYFDPPYVPLSETAYFTGYSKDGFGLESQEKLLALCQRIDKLGIQFMLSNSSSPWVIENYRHFNLNLVSANRAINSRGDKRGAINEVIVTNY